MWDGMRRDGGELRRDAGYAATATMRQRKLLRIKHPSDRPGGICSLSYLVMSCHVMSAWIIVMCRLASHSIGNGLREIKLSHVVLLRTSRKGVHPSNF